MIKSFITSTYHSFCRVDALVPCYNGPLDDTCSVEVCPNCVSLVVTSAWIAVRSFGARDYNCSKEIPLHVVSSSKALSSDHSAAVARLAAERSDL